jgi:hypothetical protein
MADSLSNPRETITLEYPMASLEEAISFFGDLDKAYIILNVNSPAHQYSFESSKFFQPGVNINIQLSPSPPKATSLGIEIRPKTAGFEHPDDFIAANHHVKDIESLIQRSMQLTRVEKTSLKALQDAKEASKEKGKGQNQYTCSHCHQNFFADNRKTLIVICPHCKTKMALAKPDKSGWGTLVDLIFLLFSIFGKGRK